MERRPAAERARRGGGDRLTAAHRRRCSSLGAGAVSLALRFRRSAADERQRLKPLAVVGVLAVLGLAVQGVPGLHAVGVVVLVTAVAILFPLALVVGALRYRVWDLDPLLVNALLYGGLALLVAAGYVAIVAVGAALGGAPVPDLGRPWSPPSPSPCCSARPAAPSSTPRGAWSTAVAPRRTSCSPRCRTGWPTRPRPATSCRRWPPP